MADIEKCELKEEEEEKEKKKKEEEEEVKLELGFISSGGGSGSCFICSNPDSPLCPWCQKVPTNYHFPFFLATQSSSSSV